MDDLEAQSATSSSYDSGSGSGDVVTRKLIKTLSAVCGQLFVTFMIVLACYNSHQFRSMTYEQANSLMIGMFVVVIVSMIACFVAHCYKNTICAFGAFIIFTIAMSVLLGIGMVAYEAEVILQALAITVLTTVACIGYVVYTRKDFTGWAGIAGCVLFFMIITSLVFIFFPPSNTIQIVYACIGIVLFIAYLLIDTSMVIHRYTEDEWMLASMAIYLDIINLFLYILKLLSACSKKE